MREEYEQLARHLASVTDLHGNPRIAAGDDERARQAVSSAIRRAMSTLSKKHTPLWRHLHRHLSTGTVCCYSPDPIVSWVMN